MFLTILNLVKNINPFSTFLVLNEVFSNFHDISFDLIWKILNLFATTLKRRRNVKLRNQRWDENAQKCDFDQKMD